MSFMTFPIYDEDNDAVRIQAVKQIIQKGETKQL